MKQIYYFSIITLLNINLLQAQDSLTSFNIPAAGDTFIAKFCIAPSINFALTGANYTWDYSSIIIATSSVTFNYLLPSQTGWASTFNTSNLARKDLSSNNYVFYTTNISMMQIDGEVQTASLEIKYDDQELLFWFPFSYQNTLSDSFYASYQSGGNPYYRKGFNSVEADGWGKLILSSGTIDSVLRIKHIETIFDSTSIISNRKRLFKTAYYWYKRNEKFPVFYVTKDSTIIGTTSYNAQQNVYVHNNYSVGVGDNIAASASFLLYPNPATRKSTLIYQHDVPSLVRISCINSAGQKIFELPEMKLMPGTFEKQIDISSFECGAYFLILEVNGTKSELGFLVE